MIINKKKILVIIIDNAVLLDSYIKDLCKKVSQRLAVLSCLPNYLGTLSKCPVEMLPCGFPGQ